MKRESCAIIAKNIGAEDEVQSAYDNIADFFQEIGVDKEIIDKIREIANEERTHRREFEEIHAKLRCHIDTSKAGTLTTKNY